MFICTCTVKCIQVVLVKRHFLERIHGVASLRIRKDKGYPEITFINDWGISDRKKNARKLVFLKCERHKVLLRPLPLPYRIDRKETVCKLLRLPRLPFVSFLPNFLVFLTVFTLTFPLHSFSSVSITPSSYHICIWLDLFQPECLND